MIIDTEDVPCPTCASDAFRLVTRTKDFCYKTCDNEFDYVACNHCDQVYLRNRPVLAHLNTIYPSEYLANDYEGHLGRTIAKLRDAFQRSKISVLTRHLNAGDIVAEIGPGAGAYLDLIRRFGNPSWEVVGVEFAETAVAELRKRGLRVIQSRIEDVEWTGSPAGAFVMNQLIEHVESPRHVLRKCFTALRPGGVMVMETPDLSGWDRKVFEQRYWAGWHAPRHWTLFDVHSITRLGREMGFEVAEVESVLSPFVILHSVQYTLSEKIGWKRLGRFFDVDRLLPLFAASGLDFLLKTLGAHTSNMRIVLKKPSEGGEHA